jgi:undecaprenyl diphosphate synthase
MPKIDMQPIPNHIAIIMDGNGRWAKKRFLSKSVGHKSGADTLKNTIEHAESLGVKYLTAYAFSTENWNRTEQEVDSLMNILKEYINKYIQDVNNNDVKITVIGDTTRLDKDLQQKIKELIEISKNKKGINVIMAMNYGGRDDITRAAKNIAYDVNMVN